MYTLLLVGFGGHGKSSLGNILLKKQVFVLNDKTKDISIQIKENKTFQIIDCHGLVDKLDDEVYNRAEDALQRREHCTPSPVSNVLYQNCDPDIINGIDNTSSNKKNQCKKKGPDEMSKIGHVETGFDALIFVIQYGKRFTKQEKQAVDRVKSVFGETVFKKWGIVVFTHGEKYISDEKFEDFFSKQTGDLKNLLDEVQNRYFLMDKNTNPKIVKDCLKKNIKALHEKNDVTRYTLDDFLRNINLNITDRLEVKCKSLIKDAEDIVSKTKLLFENIEPMIYHCSYEKILASLKQLQLFPKDHFKKDFLDNLIKKLREDITSAKETLDKLDKSLEKFENKPTIFMRTKILMVKLFIRIRQPLNCKRGNRCSHNDYQFS